MSARSGGAAVFGLLVGTWLGRALFDWVLDIGAPWEGILIAGVAVVAAVVLAAVDAADRAT